MRDIMRAKPCTGGEDPAARCFSFVVIRFLVMSQGLLLHFFSWSIIASTVFCVYYCFGCFFTFIILCFFAPTLNRRVFMLANVPQSGCFCYYSVVQKECFRDNGASKCTIVHISDNYVLLPVVNWPHPLRHLIFPEIESVGCEVTSHLLLSTKKALITKLFQIDHTIACKNDGNSIR